MAALLLVLLVLILGYNLIVNLTNISIIIKYCLATNSIEEFWPLYFKHCFSLRAIYSSVFSLFLSVFLFLCLIPIVIIRKIVLKKDFENRMNNGLSFTYDNLELPAGSWFYSNVTNFGFAMNKITATGNIAEDMEHIVNAFLESSKVTLKECSFDFMQEMYIMEEDKTAIAPLLIKEEEKVYPVYVLYDEHQINQYLKVSPLLQQTRFKDTIYFSVKNF